MVENGVIASIQCSFATSDMVYVERRIGPERIRWSYPWRTLLDAGITLAAGSDFMVETIDPFIGIQRIVTRQELDGTPPGGWFPEQRLTVEEALYAYTVGSAYNSFEEDIKGSIEPGKLADIVVLSQDILNISPYDIANTTVEITIVGGNVVYVSPETDLIVEISSDDCMEKQIPSTAPAATPENDLKAFLIRMAGKLAIAGTAIELTLPAVASILGDPFIPYAEFAGSLLARPLILIGLMLAILIDYISPSLILKMPFHEVVLSFLG